MPFRGLSGIWGLNLENGTFPFWIKEPSNPPIQKCSLAAMQRLARRTSSPAAAHGHQAAISIHLYLQGKDVLKDRPAPTTNLFKQKIGHPRMDVRQRCF